ncbi:hypothetical protein E1A91_A10G195800v1 [Gossypium mustelinum]|uniref:Uncharacterized protein n=2 Tax=Gossypium TaxID=3633 RepID=A0A5D2XNM0_GOSMU|nr:hypothetical protein E1A91_A10G195800v1 [Gossypium mustelinum]
METASFCNATTHNFITSSLPIRRIVKQLPKPCQTQTHNCCHSGMPLGFRGLQGHGLNTKPKQRYGDAVAARCAAWDSGLLAELERELEAKEEEEWVKVGRLREKCKERKGTVELLECLEREAIQGEDHGREASDYNRRAQIFDKSSKVFRALKARTQPTHSQNS